MDATPGVRLQREDQVLDPAELYRVEEGVPPANGPDGPDGPEAEGSAEGPVLVVVLDGFVDAGSAGRLAVGALREGRESRTVVTFDVDQLVDYRSRRPPLTFDTDRWAAYEPPVLDIVALTDTAEVPYLLLAGPEPDTQWERFVAAVGQLVETLGVRLVVTLQGIPMAVPHTRPIGVTAHATRKELIEGHEPWFTEAQVPGSAAALLEYRLGEAGVDVVGFAVHVPHYLARAEYPQAARTLLDHTAVATGLYLPTEELTKAGERTDADIAEQVAASTEVGEVVAALEKQYDQVAAGRAAGGLGEDLPSADELAAEVERFLADQGGDDKQGGGFGDER